MATLGSSMAMARRYVFWKRNFLESSGVQAAKNAKFQNLLLQRENVVLTATRLCHPPG